MSNENKRWLELFLAMAGLRDWTNMSFQIVAAWSGHDDAKWYAP